MSQFDLETVSGSELDDLIERAQQRKIEIREHAIQNLLNQAQWVVDESARLGVSVSKLLGYGSSAPIKYRHPDDPKLTWSGRGPKPKWLKALLEQPDSNLDSFEVSE